MRRLLPWLALCAVWTSPVQADEIPWANKFFIKQGTPTPATVLHDFGVLAKGTVKTHRFVMTNIYEVPLALSVPKPDCLCVAVVAYSAKLEPLETGYIDVMINTANAEGKKAFILKVPFDHVTENGQRYNSDAKLEIRAEIRTELQVQPGYIDFGTVAAGAKATKSATVRYYGKMPGWKITQAQSTNKNIDVKLTPPAQPGGAYTIEASLSANASGELRDEISVQTNDPAVPAFTIALVGKVEAAYSIFPGDVLRFEKPVVVGTRAEMNVIVRTVGRPFTIKKVDGQANGLSVQLLPVLPTKTQTLPVSFTPTQPGAIKQVLTFTLDNGDEIKLTVHATAVQAKE